MSVMSLSAYHDYLQSLKGIESQTISLKRLYQNGQRSCVPPYLGAGCLQLLKKHRIYFVMRTIVNLAIESFLRHSVDETILTLAGILQKWTILLDASIDTLLQHGQLNKLAWALLRKSTQVHCKLIESMFLVVASEPMMNAFHTGDLALYDDLAVKIFRSDMFWERFPSGLELLKHLGNLYSKANSFHSSIYRDIRLHLHHNDRMENKGENLNPYQHNLSAECACTTFFYSVFKHVALNVWNVTAKLQHQQTLQDTHLFGNDTDSQARLHSMDLASIWTEFSLPNPSSDDFDLTWLLECIEASIPLQTHLASMSQPKEDSVDSSFRKSLKSGSSFLKDVQIQADPLDYFVPHIIYAARQYTVSQSKLAAKESKSTKLEKTLQALNEPSVSATRVSIADLPATGPMPRSLRAPQPQLVATESTEKVLSTNVRKPSENANPSAERSSTATESRVTVSHLTGIEKQVDAELIQAAKEALLAKYQRLQANVDRRKAKAIWQVRRLKRLKPAREALEILYSEPNSEYFLNVIVSPKQQRPRQLDESVIGSTDEVINSSNNGSFINTSASDLITSSAIKKRSKKAKISESGEFESKEVFTPRRVRKGNNSSSMNDLLSPRGSTDSLSLSSKGSSIVTAQMKVRSRSGQSKIKGNNIGESHTFGNVANPSEKSEQPLFIKTSTIATATAAADDKSVVAQIDRAIDDIKPFQDHSQDKAEDESDHETNYPPIAPYLPPLVVMPSTSPPLPVTLKNSTTGNVPEDAMLHQLRRSLQVLGMEEALVGEDFLQRLCASLPVAVLLMGIADEHLVLQSSPASSDYSAQSTSLLSNVPTHVHSVEDILSFVLHQNTRRRYQGFVSFFQSLFLATKASELRLFKRTSRRLALQVVHHHGLIPHLLAVQEFFLMSPHRSSSFLLDVCLHLVERAWQRLQRHVPGNEDLWSNMALTAALRDAAPRLPRDLAALFKNARYYFRSPPKGAKVSSALESGAAGDSDSYFTAQQMANLYLPLFSKHRLLHLVIDYRTPSDLQPFFTPEIMQQIACFTQRYLEIGQLLAAYRILSIETRRSVTGVVVPHSMHLLVFELQQVLHALLRYLNDRHLTLTRRFHLQLTQHLTSSSPGIHRLLQYTHAYAAELQAASLLPLSSERHLVTRDFTEYALTSGVLLRICVEQIVHECRLFGMALLQYLLPSKSFVDADVPDKTTVQEKVQQVLTSLRTSHAKIRDYRDHIDVLSFDLYEEGIKDHVQCLRQYLV